MNERFAEIDDNKDGLITWDEYKKDAFGDDEEDNDPHSQIEDLVFDVSFSCYCSCTVDDPCIVVPVYCFVLKRTASPKTAKIVW